MTLLDQFEVRVSGSDLVLWCEKCGDDVCLIEPNDALSVLVQECEDHAEGCHA